MNSTKLARVLSTFLGQITRADMDRIRAADDKGWHAAMNLGTNAQIDAQKEQWRVTLEAIERLTPRSRELIEQALLDATEGEER